MNIGHLQLVRSCGNTVDPLTGHKYELHYTRVYSWWFPTFLGVETLFEYTYRKFMDLSLLVATLLSFVDREDT